VYTEPLASREPLLTNNDYPCLRSKVAKGGQSLPAAGWEQTWLSWARQAADGLDPMTNGYLEANRRRLMHPEEQKDDPRRQNRIWVR
jgi:hypothetical protein